MTILNTLRCVQVQVVEIALLSWRMLDRRAVIRLGMYAQ